MLYSTFETWQLFLCRWEALWAGDTFIPQTLTKTITGERKAPWHKWAVHSPCDWQSFLRLHPLPSEVCKVKLIQLRGSFRVSWLSVSPVGRHIRNHQTKPAVSSPFLSQSLWSTQSKNSQPSAKVFSFWVAKYQVAELEVCLGSCAGLQRISLVRPEHDGGWREAVNGNK